MGGRTDDESGASALHAFQLASKGLRSRFRRGNPRPALPRRIVAYVLIVPALELRHPVPLGILVEPYDAARSTIFQYESFLVTFPSRNSQWSHPRTRILTPSGVVPVSSHSETPRLPLTQWRSSP